MNRSKELITFTVLDKVYRYPSLRFIRGLPEADKDSDRSEGCRPPDECAGGNDENR